MEKISSVDRAVTIKMRIYFIGGSKEMKVAQSKVTSRKWVGGFKRTCTSHRGCRYRLHCVPLRFICGSPNPQGLRTGGGVKYFHLCGHKS